MINDAATPRIPVSFLGGFCLCRLPPIHLTGGCPPVSSTCCDGCTLFCPAGFAESCYTWSRWPHLGQQDANGCSQRSAHCSGATRTPPPSGLQSRIKVMAHHWRRKLQCLLLGKATASRKCGNICILSTMFRVKKCGGKIVRCTDPPAPQEWNKLPLELRTLSHSPSFKKRLKEGLLGGTLTKTACIRDMSRPGMCLSCMNDILLFIRFICIC